MRINERSEMDLYFQAPFVVFPDVVFFREVNEVYHLFGCQKQVFVQYLNLWCMYSVGCDYKNSM